jgi:hypothetical protein
MEMAISPTAYRVLEKWIAITEEAMNKGINPMDDIEVVVEEFKKNGRSRKFLAFRWYGGKYSHLDWLLPHA